MQKRLSGERNIQWLGHGVSFEFCFGALQRPRWMMNLAANEPTAAVEGIEAVAFRQKMFDCVRPRKKDWANRTVACSQCSRSGSGVGPMAGVLVRNGGIEYASHRLRSGPDGWRTRSRHCVLCSSSVHGSTADETRPARWPRPGSYPRPD